MVRPSGSHHHASQFLFLVCVDNKSVPLVSEKKKNAKGSGTAEIKGVIKKNTHPYTHTQKNLRPYPKKPKGSVVEFDFDLKPMFKSTSFR